MSALPAVLQRDDFHVALLKAMEAELPKPIAHLSICTGACECTFWTIQDIVEFYEELYEDPTDCSAQDNAAAAIATTLGHVEEMLDHRWTVIGEGSGDGWMTDIFWAVRPDELVAWHIEHWGPPPGEVS